MQVVLCLNEKYEKLLVLVQGPLLIVTNLNPWQFERISLLLFLSHNKADMFPEFRRSIVCRKRVKVCWIGLLLERTCS